jgi:uncharacterized phage-associated protein
MVFNDRKAAQIAAYFLTKARGSINHMKLIKLMYLADRSAMATFGLPISKDKFVSMDHGPVLSQTLNLINGEMRSSKNGWNHWVSPRNGNAINLLVSVKSRTQLDELSEKDIEVLKGVWEKFGHMNPFQLVDYCHDNCPEWVDPEGSSTPIKYAATLRAVGKSEDSASELGSLIESQNNLQRILARS